MKGMDVSMSYSINESSMNFGVFDESRMVHWEKSKLYHSLGDKVRTVEFISLDQDGAINLVEAKTSAPREYIDPYTRDISEKFIHTLDLFMSVITGRQKDEYHEIPELFFSIDIAKVKIRLILVIKNQRLDTLIPVRNALNKKLTRYIRTWRLESIVLNEELAINNGIIPQQFEDMPEYDMAENGVPASNDYALISEEDVNTSETYTVENNYARGVGGA